MKNNNIKVVLEKLKKDEKSFVNEISKKLSMNKKLIYDYINNKKQPDITFMFVLSVILMVTAKELWG